MHDFDGDPQYDQPGKLDIHQSRGPVGWEMEIAKISAVMRFNLLANDMHASS